jgi:Flagellar capping protein
MSTIQRITGMNSGLDVDALVKASMTPYQTKIDKEVQNRKILEYQQQQYQQIMSDASAFHDKYFDILKSDGLMSTTGYQTQTYTATPDGKVTAKGFAGANVDNYTVNVTQLAAKASSTLDTSTLGTKVIKIGTAEISFEAVSDGNTTVANYNTELAKMKLSLSNKVKDGTASSEEKTQLADLNNNSVTAKYSQFTKSVVFTSSQMGTDGFTLGKKNADATISYQDKAEDKYLEATIRNSSGKVYTITSADKKTTNSVTVDNIEFTFKAPTSSTAMTPVPADKLAPLGGLTENPVATLDSLKLTAVDKLDESIQDGRTSTTVDEADGTKTKTITSVDKNKSTVIVTAKDGSIMSTTNKEVTVNAITKAIESTKTTVIRSNGITTTTEVKADGTTTTNTTYGTQTIASRTTGIPQVDGDGKPTTTIPISKEIIKDGNNITTTTNLKSVDGKTTTTIKEINDGKTTTTTTSTKQDNPDGATTTEITEIKDNSSGNLTNTTITTNLATAADGSSTKTVTTTKSTTTNGTPPTVNVDSDVTEKYVNDKVSLTGQTDVTALKDKIVKFVDDYNKLLSSINTKLYETRDKDYMPLTDEQKKSMSEDQITAWEKKAQTGLLRKDSDLERITREMKSAMSSVMSGTGLYLEKIGISPVKDYADKNGMLTVDEDKLTKALQENAGDVKDLFTRAASDTDTTDKGGLLTQLKSVVYSEFKTSTSLLSKKAGLAGSATQLDNTITKNITTKKKLITKLNADYTSKENALYKKYSDLETAMQKLNSQQSSLASMLGQN